MKAKDKQVAGDHYQKLGDYQPWEVLRRWLTPEEFRGFMKGTAIAYLARERDKGGLVDIEKGTHTLQAFIEFEQEAKTEAPQSKHTPCDELKQKHVWVEDHNAINGAVCIWCDQRANKADL